MNSSYSGRTDTDISLMTMCAFLSLIHICLEKLFAAEEVEAVIHCAALKAVGESVQNPLEYYQNNITGTLTLLGVMEKMGVKNIVFSSSATVYGSPEVMPITEDCPKGQCTNPYGWTKSMMEQIMTDLQNCLLYTSLADLSTLRINISADTLTM